MVAVMFGGKVFFPPANAAAEVDRQLDFGTLAFLDKSTKGTVSIDLLNTMTVSHHFSVIKAGHAASVLLSGYPAYARLSVGILVYQSAMQAPAEWIEPFTLVKVFYDPTVTTNSIGKAEVVVGGTLESSANPSAQYIDASYKGGIIIMISY